MKKSEIRALEDAFNIPEPERKNAFVPVFEQKIKKNKHSFHFPAMMRYASAALLAVLVVGLLSVTQTAELRNQFRDNAVMTEFTGTADIQGGTPYENDSAASLPGTAETSGSGEASSSEITTGAVTEIQTEPDAVIGTAEPVSEPANTSQTATDVTSQPIVTTSASQSAAPEVSHTTTAIAQTVTSTALRTTAAAPQITSIPVTTAVTVTTAAADTTTYAENTDNTASTTTVNPSGEDNLTDSIVDSGRDFTVTPEVTYSSSEDAVNLDEYFSSDSSDINPPEGSVPPKIIQMAAESDHILIAQVNEIVYTSADGKPYTQENLTIGHIYKGDELLSAADRISLFIPGGYITAKEYTDLTGRSLYLPDDTIVYDPGGNSGTQQIGGVYMFFIKDAGTAFPDGTFELAQETDISVFEFRDGRYTSLGSSSLSITPEEIEEIL